MVGSDDTIIKCSTCDTSTATTTRFNTPILNGKSTNHRIGLVAVTTSPHAAIRRGGITAVDDGVCRAVHRLDSDRLVGRKDRRVRAVRDDNRHTLHRLVDRVLDCLERLRPARSLVRVIARIVHVPGVRPLGVEIQRPVVLIQQIPDRLLVLIRDRRPVCGRHPAKEDISWTRKRIRRKRCVLVLGTGKVGHRAAAAVRVELDGILERRPERGRVIGRPRRVGQEPAVRRGRCRVDGPRICSLA